jgi:uncharacterized protein (TIGR03067 family)
MKALSFTNTASVLLSTVSLAFLAGCAAPSQPPVATASATQSTASTAATASAEAKSASVSAAASVAAPAKPEVPKTDFDRMQGNWKGQEVGGDEGTATLKVSGHNLEYRGADPNDWYKGTFTLREDTNPKQCVFVVTGCGVPDYVGKSCMTIYQFADGTLRISGNEPGNPDPPTTFESEGSRRFMFKMQ